MDQDWSVKVADFGFARIKQANETLTPYLGSPCWICPEVLRGEPYYHKADVYSYGMVMWSVVTRRQPFQGLRAMDVALRVLQGMRPALPHGCSTPIRCLIERCWHPQPEERPTMGEVLDLLDSALSERPVAGDEERTTPTSFL